MSVTRWINLGSIFMYNILTSQPKPTHLGAGTSPPCLFTHVAMFGTEMCVRSTFDSKPWVLRTRVRAPLNRALMLTHKGRDVRSWRLRTASKFNRWRPCL